MWHVVVLLLTLFKSALDAYQRRSLLDEAKKSYLADQLSEMNKRIAHYEQIDKSVSALPDADLARLRDKITDK